MVILLILVISTSGGIIYSQNKIRNLYTQIDREQAISERLRVDLESQKLECSLKTTPAELEKKIVNKPIKK